MKETRVTFYYLASKNAFYRNDINDNIPSEAIQIAEDNYNLLFKAQSKGATIQSDKNGKPIAISGNNEIIDLSTVNDQSSFSRTVVITLKDQAQSAIQQVHHQASLVTAMGETFGPKMQDYVKTLRSIINGTDITSSTLPIAPEDPIE